MRLLHISQRSLDEAAEAARVGFWARDRPLTGSQFDTLSVRSWPRLCEKTLTRQLYKITASGV